MQRLAQCAITKVLVGDGYPSNRSTYAMDYKAGLFGTICFVFSYLTSAFIYGNIIMQNYTDSIDLHNL